MKMISFKLSSALFAILFAPTFFVGCAGSGSGTSTQAVSSYGYGTCTAGYVSSASYGCIPQGSCPTGYGTYNGSCVVATASYTGTTGYTSSVSCPYGYTSYAGSCISTTTLNTGSYAGNSCPYGYATTAYGCLPQSGCASGFGDYAGYCLNSVGQYYYLGY